MGQKWNYQIITFKLFYRTVDGNFLYHLTGPEKDSRIGYNDFISLKNHLRSKFSNEYRTDLYPDQPVFEYNCDVDDLKKTISEFIDAKLDLVECDLSFSVIDYDYVTEMKLTPEQHFAAETLHGIN